MVKIVTGRINSFKTTRLENYYANNHIGDGFISRKIMKDNLVYGYDLIQLSTNKVIPFVIRDSFWDGIKKIIYKIGPYYFYQETFKFLEEKIDEFIVNHVSPVYLDEIGVLELNGQGFDNIIRKLINSKTDLCITVRDDLLDKICERYNFKEVEIIW